MISKIQKKKGQTNKKNKKNNKNKNKKISKNTKSLSKLLSMYFGMKRKLFKGNKDDDDDDDDDPKYPMRGLMLPPPLPIRRRLSKTSPKKPTRDIQRTVRVSGIYSPVARRANRS